MNKKQTKELMAKMVEDGCIICSSPAEIHHNTHDRARGKKSDKFMPLCPHHHRLGGHGNAVHAGVETWESIFGHQDELCKKALIRVYGIQ